MSLAPHQVAVVFLELLLLLSGAWVLFRAATVPELRAALFGARRIPTWSLTGYEVVLLGLAIFLCGLVGQGLLARLLLPLTVGTADEQGLGVIIAGAGFHGLALLGWPLFHLLRSRLYADYGGRPPSNPPMRRPGWRAVCTHALTTLVLAYPVVALGGFAWGLLLQALGLPAAPQDLIGIFSGTSHPAVLAGLLLVACVVAPLNEELLFRGLIFRYGSQRFGRVPALVVSGALFGALHGNLAGFLPLTFLGIGLALAYEQTGDIRVPIVAHGLFNLNTVLVIMSGLSV